MLGTATWGIYHDGRQGSALPYAVGATINSSTRKDRRYHSITLLETKTLPLDSKLNALCAVHYASDLFRVYLLLGSTHIPRNITSIPFTNMKPIAQEAENIIRIIILDIKVFKSRLFYHAKEVQSRSRPNSWLAILLSTFEPRAAGTRPCLQTISK